MFQGVLQNYSFYCLIKVVFMYFLNINFFYIGRKQNSRTAVSGLNQYQRTSSAHTILDRSEYRNRVRTGRT